MKISVIFFSSLFCWSFVSSISQYEKSNNKTEDELNNVNDSSNSIRNESSSTNDTSSGVDLDGKSFNLTKQEDRNDVNRNDPEDEKSFLATLISDGWKAAAELIYETIKNVQNLIETVILKNKFDDKDLSNNNDNDTASWNESNIEALIALFKDNQDTESVQQVEQSMGIDKETEKHNNRAKRNVETPISDSSGTKLYGGSVFDNLLKLSEGSKSNVLKPEKATMAEILNGPVIRKILALAQAKATKTTQYNDNFNQLVLSGLPFNPDSFEQPFHRPSSENRLVEQSESKSTDEGRNRESSVPQYRYVKPQYENKIKSTLSDNVKVADNSANAKRTNAKLLYNSPNREHELHELQVTSEERGDYDINEMPGKPAVSHHIHGSLSHEDEENIGQQYAFPHVYGNSQTSFYPSEDGEIDDDKLKQPYINPSQVHTSNEVQFAEPYPLEISDDKKKYEREWLRRSGFDIQSDETNYDEEISSEQRLDRNILGKVYTGDHQVNHENPENEETTMIHNSHAETNPGYQRHYYYIGNRENPFQNNEDDIASNNMEHQYSIQPKVIHIMPSATFQLENIKYNNEHYNQDDSEDPVIYVGTLLEAMETDHEELSGNTVGTDISADMPMWNSDIGYYRSMDQNVAAETAISSSATSSGNKQNRYTGNTFVPPSMDDESNAMEEEIEDDISERISATNNYANSKKIEKDLNKIKYDKFGNIKVQDNLSMKEYNDDTFKYHSQKNDNDNDEDSIGMSILAQKDLKNIKDKNKNNALRSTLSNIDRIKMQTANKHEGHFLGNSQFDYSPNSAYKDKSLEITEFSIDPNINTILESQNKNYNLEENERINAELSAQESASIYDLLRTISSDDPHAKYAIEVRKQGTDLKKKYQTDAHEISMQTMNIHDHNNEQHISRSEFPIDKFRKGYKLNNVYDFEGKDKPDNRKIKFNKFTQDTGKISYGDMQEETQSSTSSKVAIQSKANILNENSSQNKYNDERNQYDYHDYHQEYNGDAQYDQRKKYSQHKYPNQRQNYFYTFNQSSNDMTLPSSVALDRNKIEARNKYPDFIREQKDNKPNAAIESLISEPKATEKGGKEVNSIDEEKTLLDKVKKKHIENENSYIHLRRYKKRPSYRKNFRKENIPIVIGNKNGPIKLNINQIKIHENQFNQQQYPQKSLLLQGSNAKIRHTQNNYKGKQFAKARKSSDFTNNFQVRSNALSGSTTGTKFNNKKYQDNLLKPQLNANPIERQYDVRNEKLQQKYNDLILRKKDKVITSLLPTKETNFGKTRNTLSDLSEVEPSFISGEEKQKYENINYIARNDLNAKNAASMQISSSKRIKSKSQKDPIKSLSNSYAKSQRQDDPNISHDSQIIGNTGTPESKIFNKRKNMQEEYLTSTNLLSDHDHRYTKNKNRHILKDNSRGTTGRSIIKNNLSKITKHPYSKTQIGNTHHMKNFLKGSNKNSAGTKIESMRKDQGNQLEDLYRTKIPFNNVRINQHGLIENNVKNEKLKEDQEVTVNLVNSAKVKGDQEVKGAYPDGWIATETFVKDRIQNKKKFDISKEVEKTAAYKKASAETLASGNIEDDEQRHVQTDNPHNRKYNSNISKADVGEINALGSIIENKGIDKISTSSSKNAHAEIEMRNKENNNNRRNFKYFNNGKAQHSFNSINGPSAHKVTSGKKNVNPNRVNNNIPDMQSVINSTLKKDLVPSISMIDLQPSLKHSCDNNDETREIIREMTRLYQMTNKQQGAEFLLIKKNPEGLVQIASFEDDTSPFIKYRLISREVYDRILTILTDKQILCIDCPLSNI